ncbi:hypothetical protein ALC56_05438, partial [Trachymyrmex septentrionalis]
VISTIWDLSNLERNRGPVVRNRDSGFPLDVANSPTMSLSIEKTQGVSKDTPRRGLRAIQGLEFPQATSLSVHSLQRVKWKTLKSARVKASYNLIIVSESDSEIIKCTVINKR